MVDLLRRGDSGGDSGGTPDGKVAVAETSLQYLLETPPEKKITKDMADVESLQPAKDTIAAKEALAVNTDFTGYRWIAVWCNKVCQQQECSKTRTALAEAIWEVGGVLECLKKAGELEKWCASRDRFRGGWMLLTDWRQAKPSLQALAQSSQDNLPQVVVIYADSPRQFNKAKKWAEDLPARGMRDLVHVVPEMGSARGFAAHLSSFRGQRTLPPQSLPSTRIGSPDGSDYEGRASLVSEPDSEEGCWVGPTLARAGDSFAAPLAAPREACSYCHSDVYSPVQLAVDSCCIGRGTPELQQTHQPFVIVEAHNWIEPVLLLMAAVFPRETPKEVEGILAFMTPDWYED